MENSNLLRRFSTKTKQLLVDLLQQLISANEDVLPQHSADQEDANDTESVCSSSDKEDLVTTQPILFLSSHKIVLWVCEF